MYYEFFTFPLKLALNIGFRIYVQCGSTDLESYW